MSSAKRSIAIGFLAMSLAGCAVGADPNAWSGDTGSAEDAVSGFDVRDVQLPRDITPTDVAHDAPRADTSTGVDRIDVSIPRDSGTVAPMCPSACTADSQCSSLCPSAGAGFVNCCSTNSGSGFCYQASGGACPIATPDAGTTGMPDAGVIPLPGGGPGSACSADSECNSGSTCCVILFGGVGVCGCAVPGFGCLPASGGTC